MTHFEDALNVCRNIYLNGMITWTPGGCEIEITKTKAIMKIEKDQEGIVIF